MQVVFSKVILHNFLSFKHSEFDLSNRNYCLVKGVNNCPLDNALSNGAGKSSFVSAICWALSGETVSGGTNVKNIYVDEKECYVTLLFKVDNDSYEITRTKEPSPNLTIIKNGEDISGKGIRESAIILAQQLPDLTKDLLTSVIILGQGLPNSFTRNTPIGRKEVLERISKSDYMIQDIKDRISNRMEKLNNDIKNINEDLIKDNTEINIHNNSLKTELENLQKISTPVDFDALIEKYNKEIVDLSTEVSKNKTELDKVKTSLELIQKSYNEFVDKKDKELDNARTYYEKCYKEKTDELNPLSLEIIKLQDEIKTLKNIKDVCPTCGQKIPGVFKQDTTKLEEELDGLFTKKSKITKLITVYNDDYDREKTTIKERFNKDTENASNEMISINKTINAINETIKNLEDKLVEVRVSLSEVEIDKNNHNILIQTTNDKISSLNSLITDLNKSIEEKEIKKSQINEHLAVVKQMETLVKRDFRGFLLSNVIDFINKQAKDYCNDIYGTTELEFKLDGNNIDIEYCGKDYSALSGGEKQRVDVIIQFTIRRFLEVFNDFSSNILVLDEITDNLDAVAATKVINFISNRLSDVESVFIISHHADELELPVDSEIVITKNENGISSI